MHHKKVRLSITLNLTGFNSSVQHDGTVGGSVSSHLQTLSSVYRVSIISTYNTSFLPQEIISELLIVCDFLSVGVKQWIGIPSRVQLYFAPCAGWDTSLLWDTCP